MHIYRLYMYIYPSFICFHIGAYIGVYHDLDRVIYIHSIITFITMPLYLSSILLHGTSIRIDVRRYFNGTSYGPYAGGAYIQGAFLRILHL